MAKLAILAGLLVVAVLAIADARTTITTTVIEENKGGEMQYCHEEMQGMQFNKCQMYLTMGPEAQEYMWQCCEEMTKIGPDCRCEAIQEVLDMVMAQMRSKSYKGQGMVDMMYSAMNLPKMCNWKDWKQPPQCQIKSPFV